jgi:hypothetical protein
MIDSDVAHRRTLSLASNAACAGVHASSGLDLGGRAGLVRARARASSISARTIARSSPTEMVTVASSRRRRLTAHRQSRRHRQLQVVALVGGRRRWPCRPGPHARHVLVLGQHAGVHAPVGCAPQSGPTHGAPAQARADCRGRAIHARCGRSPAPRAEIPVAAPPARRGSSRSGLRPVLLDRRPHDVAHAALLT